MKYSSMKLSFLKGGRGFQIRLTISSKFSLLLRKTFNYEFSQPSLKLQESSLQVSWRTEQFYDLQ